ncbi:biotin--[acetyl-CoA-carboxylase] ligase and biotin operon repressor [Paucilactobacillus hokkaidonensis JCM 18461]|uniref:Bifunctional ligase/repressor BirA n=2 Tax=Paucilactobacillus hokkaidonensis TaxID=1193095 RepID=A0A0A1H154_9LACO|nr:biotin--[acetyl-CoA-carboxylase] ligase [Paucilactobacillus hokkaidonensis]BAP86451.1 biotin--[acetyl-CoA-carboxylase] ligase and biotin operon repressor [Paucilactobacillus hokkaidonensis JCM 18461]
MSTKTVVLQYLNEHQNNWTSSEKLVEQLNVSRTAIWKAVKQLQADGQQITSQSGRGYRYTPNQQLNQAIISQGMINDCHVEVYDTIDSTNRRAKELAVSNKSEPAVIIANEQTGGYGRFGREFYSPAQTGIYLSFLLPIRQNLIHPGLLTTGTAVAVARVLEEQYQVKVGIKWVNDLIVKNHKVSGILSEAVTDFESGQIGNVITGIGINLENNQLIPESLDKKVGAINQNHLQVNRNETVIKIINTFWQMTEHFNAGELMDEYRQRCIVIGQDVTIKVGNQTVQGRVENIDNYGALVLTTSTGESQTLSAGEITKLNLMDGDYHG